MKTIVQKSIFCAHNYSADKCQGINMEDAENTLEHITDLYMYVVSIALTDL